MPQPEFDIFISYNRADQPAVLKLATQLRDRGIKPWLDVWNLVAGEPWLPAVERALQSSAACAVMVGPNGLGGVHEHEMWTAIERSLSSPQGQAFRVIPVLLPHSTRGDRANRTKNEIRHPVKLTRPFALLDREITFEELIAFSTKYTGYMQQFDAKPADAGFGPDWYDSVGFCRWLSQQSGLLEEDQPYANPDSLDKEQYPRESNEAANWAPRNWPLELGRRGFRLPTESEWEAASRAATRTTYGFGSETELLKHFGWFNENSEKHVHPARELRPSHRGLFDMHGNLFEWTHDWYEQYGGVDVITDPLGAKGGSNRVLRGGSWSHVAANCRSAYRYTYDPTHRTINFGFRLALSPFGASPEAAVGKGAEPSGVGTEGASAEQRPEMP